MMHAAISILVWLSVFLFSALAFAQDDPEVGSKTGLALSLFEMMAPVLAVLFGWVAMHFNGWIKTKTKNETLAGMLARANDLVWHLVKEAQQTAVRGIKAAREPDSPEGAAITKGELLTVKLSVVAKFKELWGKAGLGELGKILGLDGALVDAWIGSRVEAAVHDLKRDPQPPTP